MIKKGFYVYENGSWSLVFDNTIMGVLKKSSEVYSQG